ncbi:hypothetical protein LAZ67_20002254 [Cordylochernes scorpioides]|uniref:ATP-dependent DNA helicase n=1 Tax=Cordylochernes scorpioides TaxID=51811 RepID=A0ABY6LKL0_9ARAC|nr:hypothetical protein LAZ67_20002254 [Cordylochernes scorpioides]
MIEQTHNQVPQDPTTDSTVAASLRTLTLCLDQLLNREPEEAITYDGEEPAAHLFSQLESQPNFQNLEPARQARKALSSLRGEPRKIAQDLALLNKTYEEVKESLCVVYPRRPSFTLQEFYELKCTSMAEIETYYKNKVRIGLAINLPKSAIVQALSNGVPPLKLPNNDHRARAEHLPPPWTRPHHILAVTVADNTGTHSVSSEGPTSGLFGPLHLRSTTSSNPKDRLGLQVSTRPQQRRAREKPSNANFGSRTPPKLNEPTCTLNQHTPVISLRPYRTPYAYQKEIQDQVSQLLKHDIITPSSSPYSSPVTLVRKRDNTMRLCIDFHRVNELVTSDLHPLPLIETVLDNLSKARVFSTVDISNAYYQIPIAEESQPLLSFVTQQGQYNFKRLPFGFKSAPQIFERVITQLIHKHHLSFITHYYDDFVIFSDSSEQHLTHLRLFFKFCLEENLQLNLKKCNFYQNEIDFLGYHITAGTYTPNIKNTEFINAIRTPINIKTLQSFLGAVNVYHKFIPEYARLRHPLNQLLKKNAKWLWSPNCQQAFDKLKQHLATQPVLHLFQEGLPCQVYCDASTQGIAGVLKQVHPDGNIYPVQYYSRALRSYERNYTISELECLAIVECVDKFRVYLLGTRFVIYSDHHALQWLKTIKDPTGRLFRWSLRLSAYDYEVKYLKGSRQYEADLLSRNPFCGFLSTGQIKDHQGELRRDTRYILNDKDLMTITRRGVTKIIVPPSLRGTLLQRAHRDFNHPGISQMTRLIAAQYYWDGMTNDIRTHVVSRYNYPSMYKTTPENWPIKGPTNDTYATKRDSTKHIELPILKLLNHVCINAVEFVSRSLWIENSRDIAVFPHDCGLVRISPLNPNCDPMTYPLLFPAGDPGWAIGILHEENMRTSTRNHVTMLQFYSYRLAIRPGFSSIHYGRRLFQQYVVDAYVKTEGNRLNYIRQNQSLLRVELYQGLMDYIHEQEHSRGVRIGRIFILPSSFPGSSRAMQQNYQDAMAIVRKFGRPDLFVTFTCNPRWTDIVENLLPNQNPSDRPDLVARVFNLKLPQLLHEIISQHLLGVVIARVHVVEFQKRGLRHAHMLFMLRDEDKPRDRDAIDRLVCAEIPSPTMQVQLYDMVRKHMIHGPCGNFNLRSPCMSDGKCTKDFPKSFLQLTEANNNGYPRYRRRDDGQTLVVGTHEVDNRWVVPYNPYLLVRFNAHINVEVCASVKSVKYLFKYVYKGHDRAEVEVSVGELDMESRAHDEIKNFLDARYVSAPEAMWRMFEYRLHAHSHTICRLAVHLPNFQSVYFVEGSEEQALENASRRRTTLTAWFQLNCVNVSARSLLYGDIPSAYVFRQNQWSARVRGGALCIGRICSVNPKDSERYHLRLLLLHVAGAQSFEDLRTVDDIVCSTFKEAAQRRGLLADESEWDACLAEAALFQMPCQLRQLFATILIYNNPTDPVSLWTKYKGYLSEDFSRATSDAAAEQMTLRELEFQLRENRLSCHHYGLPAALTPLFDSGEDHLDVNAELQIGTEMYRSLTPDQKSIVDTIVDSLNVNPRCFFIDGPGGMGKTYVYNTLIHCVRAVGKIVIPLASTGIAATLLSGGQTVHSRFKLPIPLLENSVAAISANSSEAELIRRSSLIIWDEAPMAHYRALEIVDRLLKDIMHCDLAFGGKVVVLGGDFRQVLPVVPRASRAEIVAACIKQSKLWPLFVILRLTQNMRAGIDAQSFSQWLLKVGDGDLPTDQQGLISLPESCIFHGVDLVQEIFGSSYGDITALSQSVILTPKNTDSLEINEKVLDRLPNRSQCFLSVDSVECENVEEQNNYPTEFLNSLTPTGMPPHRLNLKIGAIVMLLRNLNPKQGLCNGTRMVIQRMRSHVLEAQILTGTKVGQTVLVPKISLAPSDTNLPFILKRRQFPLRQKYYGLRPYHVENTGSRPITEVKQRRARVVTIFRQKYYGLRPYHVENTGSRPITEVKQRRARPEIGKSNQGRIIARGRIIGIVELLFVIS